MVCVGYRPEIVEARVINLQSSIYIISLPEYMMYICIVCSIWLFWKRMYMQLPDKSPIFGYHPNLYGNLYTNQTTSCIIAAHIL